MIAALQVVAKSRNETDPDKLAGILAEELNEVGRSSAVDILGALELPGH